MHWLRRLFRKRSAERELDRELRFHMEQRIAELTEQGATAEEARRRTNLEFGNLEQFKEECRDARVAYHLEVLGRDFRFAFRGLAKDKRFAIVAMFALALGIGASTAIFSVIQNGIIEPFPYKDADRLVTFWVQDQDIGHSGHRSGYSFSEFDDFRKQNHVFDAMVGNAELDVVQTADRATYRFGADVVTEGSCELLGVPPALGRCLEPGDYQPGAPPVFIMRYAAWVSQFGGDPKIVGKTFVLNGVPRTLVGIMGPRFAWGGVEMWIPRDPFAGEIIVGNFPQYWSVLAHLKPDVSIAEAQADLNVIAQRLSKVYPRDYPKHFAVHVDSFTHAVVGDGFRRALYFFFASVGLLLLIGCGNVANLLLVRATTRAKELAVRTALGASRSRIVRQLLAESFLLALGAALLGILIAWGGVEILAAVMPQFTVPSETVIQMNGAVLAFALAVGVLTVFIFGLVPALQASHCDVIDALRDSGKGLRGSDARTRLRSFVIVAEVALSLMLLFAAGLSLRSFIALQSVPLGFQPDHVIVARVPLPLARYKDATHLSAFYRPLLDGLNARPGITSAAVTSSMPGYGGVGSEVQIAGKPHSDTAKTIIQLCSEGFFSALRIPLLEGRTFSEADVNDGRLVAVINQAFRRRYFGGENPIGHRIHLQTLKEIPDPVRDPWFEIIGVVADAKNEGLQYPIEAEVWVPFTITGSGVRGIMARTTLDTSFALKQLAEEVWIADRSVALAQPNTLEYFINLFDFAQPRFGLFLVAIFAAIGLLLASIGVYSVIAYSTSRRRHEIGIRMALGAAGMDVVKMILRNGFVLVIAGIGLGAVVSLSLSKIITRQFWGVPAFDILTLAAVSAVLLAVGLLACAFPAYRATRIDPATALRYE